MSNTVSVVPVVQYVSRQNEVVEFVESFGLKVETNASDAVPPHSFDVWLPDAKLAIEYNELFWQTGEKAGVYDKKQARAKYVACSKAEVKLMQFYSDEWINKNEVCKSMIANALGQNTIKLNARDCEARVISSIETKPFLDKSHISGATRARHHVGLYHPDHGLVSVATVRTPIQKKWGRVAELARMACLPGITVRGGASKLIKHVCDWAQKDGYVGLLSYSELRYGDGNVYEMCGLKLVATALNNYGYCDGLTRFNRFKYRAQPSKTEKQVADENNVRPVYGAGNNVYLIKFSDPVVTPTS